MQSTIRSLLIMLPLALVACQGSTSPGPTIAGQYALISRDGIGVPCCATKDSGAYAMVDSVDGATIDLTGDGVYTWSVTPNYTYSSGVEVTGTSFIFEYGNYTWNGQTLTLLHASGAGPNSPISGSISDNVIALQLQGHEYQFMRLIDTP